MEDLIVYSQFFIRVNAITLVDRMVILSVNAFMAFHFPTLDLLGP